jgi:hypothetical protein
MNAINQLNENRGPAPFDPDNILAPGPGIFG